MIIKTKLGDVWKIQTKFGKEYFIYKKRCLNCKGHLHTSEKFGFNEPCIKCKCRYWFGWHTFRKVIAKRKSQNDRGLIERFFFKL